MAEEIRRYRVRSKLTWDTLITKNLQDLESMSLSAPNREQQIEYDLVANPN
ncbi:hypothetical protein Syun_012211 [Stephania yunnanensis]|uniref:Uncharacterized protein n=1 Tax=Stephania yunnanensis TaxID=152371 RepID=A0AAP0PJ97_9MAGN